MVGDACPATGGALYGQAVHGTLAAFRRPGSRSTIPRLYLAGGSVHPGPGVPMAVLSGRLVAETRFEFERDVVEFHYARRKQRQKLKDQEKGQKGRS